MQPPQLPRGEVIPEMRFEQDGKFRHLIATFARIAGIFPINAGTSFIYNHSYAKSYKTSYHLESGMRFSLIVATKNRTTELGAFFQSLCHQNTLDFEAIIVDQNDDDRLRPIIDAYKPYFPIRWLRSTIANSSHARNLGIALAKGDLISFPDDDCIYPEGLLLRVDQHFKANPSHGLLTGPARAPNGMLGSGRWTKYSCIPDYRNIWTCVIEFVMFLHPSALPITPYFDEELGIGARFGSGEGVDLALRLKRAGAVLFYDFDLAVIHPDKSLTAVAVRRAFIYGTGFGRVLRKHNSVIPLTTIITYAIRPLGGLLLAATRMQWLHVRYYTNTFRGRLQGYLADARMPVETQPKGGPAAMPNS